MSNTDNTISLQRYTDAQKTDFEQALSEIRNGRKQTHWMWYIFPQIAGLGFSETSRYYAIKDLAEAERYLNHQILGKRLILICEALLALDSNNAEKIFGNPDVLKLQSSMTLFSSVTGSSPLFSMVLDKFFDGMKDKKTLEKIAKA